MSIISSERRCKGQLILNCLTVKSEGLAWPHVSAEVAEEQQDFASGSACAEGDYQNRNSWEVVESSWKAKSPWAFHSNSFLSTLSLLPRRLRPPGHQKLLSFGTDAESEVLPKQKQNDALSNNIPSNLDKWYGQEICHTIRRSIPEKPNITHLRGRWKEAAHTA